MVMFENKPELLVSCRKQIFIPMVTYVNYNKGNSRHKKLGFLKLLIDKKIEREKFQIDSSLDCSVSDMERRLENWKKYEQALIKYQKLIAGDFSFALNDQHVEKYVAGDTTLEQKVSEWHSLLISSFNFFRCDLMDLGKNVNEAYMRDFTDYVSEKVNDLESYMQERLPISKAAFCLTEHVSRPELNESLERPHVLVKLQTGNTGGSILWDFYSSIYNVISDYIPCLASPISLPHASLSHT